MKKILCVFIICLFMSACTAVSADVAYTCTPRLNAYVQENIIIFDFELSDNMPNEKFLIASYNGDKLTNSVFYTIDKIRAINAENAKKPERYQRNFISISYETTPDKIKIFALNDHIIPVCEKTVLFETKEELIAINSNIVYQLENAITLLTENKNKFKSKETRIINSLISLSQSALAKQEDFILTREFALRTYEEEINSILSVYDSMTDGDGGEKSTFRNKINAIEDENGTVDYLIKYLGIMEYLS